MASSGSSSRVMEKPGQELLQQQQQALKCPRCDSSNTKFCYYNNYSLSQPRHFCKACKRYWTRGGTLRNVPVGGGCRKNKRVKRSNDTSNNSSPSPSSSAPSCNYSKQNLSSKSHMDSASTSSNPSSHINISSSPLFYGFSTSSANNSCDVNVMDLNPSFSRVSGYDLQPQLNALGFGFGLSSSSSNAAFLSNAYNSMFGCSESNPVMASLLSSTLLQQKFMKDDNGNSNSFQGLGSLEEMVVASKEVKVEGQNRNMESWNNNCQSNMQMEQHVGFSDPSSSLYWNAVGAWSDNQPNNIGPNSVTSLI